MEYKISSEDFWYQIDEIFGKDGGVYILSCLDENELVIPVSRLLRDDTKGILYIGKASSFLDRVIDLKKSLSPEHLSTGHECGVRHKTHVGICKKFPYERLQVTLIGSNNPEKTENEKLQNYKKEFGELPPLNRIN